MKKTVTIMILCSSVFAAEHSVVAVKPLLKSYVKEGEKEGKTAVPAKEAMKKKKYTRGVIATH